MGFKELLKEKLKSRVKDLDLLPSSYQIIGDVCLFKLKDELLEYKQDIGKAVLELIPRVKTVCLIKKIEGEFREPEVDVIAGGGTITIHKENRCVFELDAAKIMWSKGNQEEKRRMIELVKDGEVIIDMFSGVGYWSIPLAKNKDVKIYAIEYNPTAYFYLKKNIELNNVQDKIIPIEGDCRKEILKLKGDRIIMGYFPNTVLYLEAAKVAAKDRCWIHYHDICDVGEENMLLKKVKEVLDDFEVESKFRVVKRYSPGVNHIVFDLKLRRKV